MASSNIREYMGDISCFFFFFFFFLRNTVEPVIYYHSLVPVILVVNGRLMVRFYVKGCLVE